MQYLFSLQKQLSFKRKHGRLGPNMMLYDLGIEIHPNTTANEVRQSIESVDELFDLVLVVERMDESLIFLKELLCWEYSDLVFFTKNARKDEVKKEISQGSIEKLKRLQSADALLYNHFLAKHNKAVIRYGKEKMENEVSILRSLRQSMFEDCGVRMENSFDNTSIFKEYSNQVNGYVLDEVVDLNCLSLALPELQFVEKIRRYQGQRIANEYYL